MIMSFQEALNCSNDELKTVLLGNGFSIAANDVIRMLTDRGTEFCGKVEQHDYELYLALNDIEHTKTKARHPQTTVFVSGKLSCTEWYILAGASTAGWVD